MSGRRKDSSQGDRARGPSVGHDSIKQAEILILYGDGHKLALRNHEEGGFVADVSIPFSTVRTEPAAAQR